VEGKGGGNHQNINTRGDKTQASVWEIGKRGGAHGPHSRRRGNLKEGGGRKKYGWRSDHLGVYYGYNLKRCFDRKGEIILEQREEEQIR